MIPFIVFLVSSVSIYFSYAHTHNYLVYNTIKFGELCETRQYYVVKNVIKGIYLAILVLAGAFTILPGIFYDNWNNNIIRIFASMYVSNDFVGLYRVTVLPTSTRLHHTASIILLLVAWNIDFQNSNVGQLLLVYTYFSALAFPVNLYLGLRMCYEDLHQLRDISTYVYLLSCLCNWYFQMYWVVLDLDTIMYLLVMCAIVMDDIILLRWLWS